MRAPRVLIALTALIACAGAPADDHHISDAGSSGIALIADQLDRREAPALELVCRVATLSTAEVATPLGRFTELTIPGFATRDVIGAPALPVLTRLVEVPFGADVAATVVASRRVTTSLAALAAHAPIMPRQPPHPKDGSAVPFAYERSAYRMDGRGRDPVVQVEEVGVLRDARLVLLRVSPISYDPVGGRLEVLTEVRIRLTARSVDLSRTARIKRRYGSRSFAELAGVLRPASLRPRSSLDARGDPGYLIVADRMFESALAPFVAWKASRGFRVTTAFTDVIGRSPERIQSYVRARYEHPTADAPAPSFLLLVGDHEQVPAFAGKTGEHITDLYYGAMTPGDAIPDILVGRFSAFKVEQLVAQVEKTIAYERSAPSDASVLKSSALIAGWDSGHAVEWGWPQIQYAARNVLGVAQGFTGTRTFLSSGPNQNVPGIKNLLSRGCALVNYTAHGSQQRWSDPQFSVFDVDELRNDGRYPLVIANCCLTGGFQLDTCLGEAWLRAPRRGAIGYIGASDNTMWDEDLWWAIGTYPILHPNPSGAPPERSQVAGGAFNAAFPGGTLTSAAIMLAGNLSVEQSTTSKKLYYWEVYHLLGDPSLTPRLRGRP